MRTVEMVTPEKATELWPLLKPMLAAACESNEISKDEFEPEDVYLLVQTGMAAMFVFYEDDVPACTVVFQFHMTGDKKGADIISMGGKNLMKFKALFWPSILQWLRANGVQFVDAYANERIAQIYKSKFGFSKSCAHVRMSL
jgi:hypothetical protein